MKILTSPDPKLIELMQREATVLQLLDHPGLPRVTSDDYLTFTPAGAWELHCLVMQQFSGQNLEQYIEARGRISQVTALSWLSQLVQILDLLHRAGFFHRDIKPSNIIVQPDGQLALIDFGAVREVTSTYLAKLSSQGGKEITAVRTPRFSPLEQINGQAVPQSDFYALGRSFVYLVTGIPLIDLPTDRETGRIIWRNKAPQIDKPFADLLDDLQAPFPAQRPYSTQVILQRLSRLPLRSKLDRLFKSKWFQAGLVGLALLALGGIYLASLPVAANYFFDRGMKAERENRSEDAGADFQLAVQLQPGISARISSFYFERAARARTQPSVARKYYELAIKFNPNDVDAYNNLALVCQEANDFNCAQANYQKALKLQPNSWNLRYNLGSFYDQQGQLELAEKEYKLAVDLGGKNAVDALSTLSRLANRRGKFDEAIALAKKGLNETQDPITQAALYKNLGWAFWEQSQIPNLKSKISQAETYLKKSLQLDPERTDTYCLLAQVQEALGQMEKAKLYWEACLLTNSSEPEVVQWREQLLERLLR
jgi:serine/threonine protein kinase